jgi:hypothetical protein
VYYFSKDRKNKSFKWRNYDPAIGRFFNIDPLSEKYAYQSHYNFSENAVVNARELEGLEKVLIYGNGTAAAGAAATPSRTTGAYTELKGYVNYSLRFWGGVAETNYNLLKGGATFGIAVAARVLKSEDSKGSDSREADVKEKKKEQLAKNGVKGKEAEKEVTKDLEDEFPDEDVLTQVTGKFKDGKTTVFDNVMVNKKSGKVTGTNETKTGDAKLTKAQKRYRNGETVELKGEKAGNAAGQKINIKTTPDRVTRR